PSVTLSHAPIASRTALAGRGRVLGCSVAHAVLVLARHAGRKRAARKGGELSQRVRPSCQGVSLRPQHLASTATSASPCFGATRTPGDTMNTHHAHSRSDSSSAMVRDPVCGMTLDAENAAAQFEHHGHTFYFCSARCAQRFEAQPEGFVDAASGTGEAGHVHHVRASQASQSSLGATEYTCPMHPEVVRDAPGSC